MRHHEYDAYNAESWPRSVCVHCKHMSGLTTFFQLESMPGPEMATCPSPNAPRLGLWGWLIYFATGSIDCWKRPTDQQAVVLGAAK